MNKLGEISTKASLRVLSAPVFLQKFDQIDGVEGCDIKIFSLIESKQKPSIKWLHNNNEIDLKAGNKFDLEINKNENWEIKLKIKNATKLDAGQYQCIAENEAGRSNCFGKVVMHPLTAPRFVKKLEDEIVLPENKEVYLEVKVAGIPIPEIQWFKDNEEINLENNKFTIKFDQHNGVSILKSNEIDKNLSGVYTAKANNPGGEILNKCKVTINGSHPVFLNKPEKLTCLAGKSAILGCSFDGEPEPEAVWFFKNKELKNDLKTKISYDISSKSSLLEIEKCSKKDEGSYTVTIKNIHGSQTAVVSLNITEDEKEVQDYKLFLKASETKKFEVQEEKPDWGKLKETEQNQKIDNNDEQLIKLKKIELLPEFLLKPLTQKSFIGQEINFKVVIKSPTKCEVMWKINDIILENKGKIKLEKDENKKTYYLTIKRLEKENEGLLKCIAKNNDGETEEICEIKIIGKNK